MEEERKRSPSEVLKRGYSDEEVSHIYELGRLSLENGNFHRAEAIMSGLIEIVPDFAPAWLGMTYIHMQNHNIEAASATAEHALRLDADSAEALLFLVSCLLSSGDFSTAGTYLGEVGERVDAGLIDHPNLLRFYRSQLARFQNRS